MNGTEVAANTVRGIYDSCGATYPKRPHRRRKPETLRREEYAIGAMFGVLAVVLVVAATEITKKYPPLGPGVYVAAALLSVAAALLLTRGIEWLQSLIVRMGRVTPTPRPIRRTNPTNGDEQ